MTKKGGRERKVKTTRKIISMPWGRPMNEMSGVACFQILSTRWPRPRYRAQSCSAREPPDPSSPLSLPQTTLPHASQVFPTQLPPHSHLSRGRTEASLQAPACQSVALQIPPQHVVHRCLNVKMEMVWQAAKEQISQRGGWDLILILVLTPCKSADYLENGSRSEK